ncbi:MAG: DNA cytosine methyltransferase [Kiritimatiellae bacterium]|nr:DNA cytosine methyltransferase [Kiritimatiellia bacterium]
MRYGKPRQVSYRIVSLFAGCGGLDLGFIGGFNFLGREFCRNNFDVVWANELNPNACKTYERNFGSHIVCGDIKDAIELMPTDVDVIMGGFPCQDISINGKMLGIKGKRSSLYSYIVEAVKRCNPKAFLAENVGSLMLKQNEYSFRAILSDFESLDYHITYKVYHAEQYGVPQTRERIIFVGTRKDLPDFTHPKPVLDKPITCGEALHDLECKPADKEFSHIWSAAAPSAEQGSRKMVEDRPGYTIRAECHGNIQFHYRLPRRLSMREAARIQSFPDSFVFPCGLRETERQIGNAVPPVLAWHIAREVQKVLEVAK